MAPRGRSRYANSLAALRAAGDIFDYVHPDYKYHKQDWDLIRDLIVGERRVKEMGRLYLPALGKDSGSTYESYKDRAVYVNMLARTVNSHMGTIFRRPLKVTGIDEVQRKRLESIGYGQESLNTVGKNAARELDTLARVGLLLDRDELGANDPYITTYVAENILSWKEQKVDGRMVLTYVLLREVVEDLTELNGSAQPTITKHDASAMTARYRVLRLNSAGHYVQDVYEPFAPDPNRAQMVLPTSPKTYVPKINGQPMTFIPMVIFGPDGISAAVQKSPVLDIAHLSLAHYRTSAQLEHGRFFTALPVYYVSKAPGGSEQAEYTLGPSVVWETAPGEKPGILEFYGTGLKTLQDSLIEKEEAISQLGGRIMGIRAAATSEAEAIFKMKQANETSILLGITESLAEALTRLLRWYFTWIGREKDANNVRVMVNQDFKALMISARELRALALLYQEGILPVDEVYRVLQEAEFVNDEVTLEEFKAMLTDPMQFPGQPNVEAMREGFANATDRDKARLSKEEDDRAAKSARDLQDQKGKQDAAAAKTAAATAQKVAAAQPNQPAPGNPANRGPGNAQ